MSCKDEEVKPGSSYTPVNPNVPGPNNPTQPDSIVPGINISSPKFNSDLMVFEYLIVYANISDNKGLDEVRLFIVDPSGTRSEIEGLEHLKSLNNAVNTIVNLFMRLPTNSAIGAYTLVIEAEDMKQNVSKDSVAFNVHAPDLNIAEFTDAFIKNGFIAAMADWEESFLSERSFGSGFFYVMDRDRDSRILKAEWEKFVKDFDLSNQVWTTWDVNGDGNLSELEFKNGLGWSKLFNEWDQNKDGLVRDEELAIGVFGRWDDNMDGKLTRAEYLERLSAYFYP